MPQSPSGPNGTSFASTCHPNGSNSPRTIAAPANGSSPDVDLTGTAGTRSWSGSRDAANSGWDSLRPFMAVLNTLPNATASIEDAAYGRSVT